MGESADPMMTMGNMQKLAALIMSSEIDVLVGDEAQLVKFAGEDGALPLNDYYTREEQKDLNIVSFNYEPDSTKVTYIDLSSSSKLKKMIPAEKIGMILMSNSIKQKRPGSLWITFLPWSKNHLITGGNLPDPLKDYFMNFSFLWSGNIKIDLFFFGEGGHFHQVTLPPDPVTLQSVSDLLTRSYHCKNSPPKAFYPEKVPPDHTQCPDQDRAHDTWPALYQVPVERGSKFLLFA
jgi:hypothetical protein